MEADRFVIVMAAAAILALCLILCVWLAAITVKLRKTVRRFERMMGAAEVENLEEVVANLQADVKMLQSGSQRQEAQVDQIWKRIERLKAHVGVHRYNAFSEGGSDLSFSIAIVDEQQSGVVITGLHNREDTYIYAKPLDHGQSKHTLSPEEREAINQALPKA